MNEDIPWSRCCKVNSLFNDWIFSQWMRILLAQWLNFHLLTKDFTLQHREQGISSFIQWFFFRVRKIYLVASVHLSEIKSWLTVDMILNLSTKYFPNPVFFLVPISMTQLNQISQWSLHYYIQSHVHCYWPLQRHKTSLMVLYCSNLLLSLVNIHC